MLEGVDGICLLCERWATHRYRGGPAGMDLETFIRIVVIYIRIVCGLLLFCYTPVPIHGGSHIIYE